MTASMAIPVKVTIAVPLQRELIEPIEAVDSRIQVAYEPDLLPPLRFPNDHRGVDGFQRTPEDERRWWDMLGAAEVLFGIPGDSPQGLAQAIRACPDLRWMQATAAGAGEQVGAAELTAEELDRVIVTSAAGVHAGPLAEFALLGMLAFAKNLPRLRADQRARRWSHYAMDELSGRTVLIVGLGQIGAEVARLAAAFGMRVIGLNRTGAGDYSHVDELARIDALATWLPRSGRDRDLATAHRRDPGPDRRGGDRSRSSPAPPSSTSAAAPSSMKPRWSRRCATAGCAAPRSTCSPPSRSMPTARCGICRTCL